MPTKSDNSRPRNPAITAKIHSALTHLYSELSTQPVFMEASSLRLMHSSVFNALERINGKPVDSELLDFIFLFDDESEDDNDLEINDGVAVIPIARTLTNLPADHFLVRHGIYNSYDQIRNLYDQAINAADVNAIMYQMDSPGGVHAGLMDLLDYLYSSRGKKPTIAMVEEDMFSAAYGIGSTADEIWITRSSAVGSVGTLLVHTEESKWLNDEGLKVTDFTYGRKKSQFAYWKPLSEEAKADLQEMVDIAGQEFTANVARNLGTSFKMVKSLEAGIFEGQKAIGIGLASRIVQMRDAMDEIKKLVNK